MPRQRTRFCKACPKIHSSMYIVYVLQLISFFIRLLKTNKSYRRRELLKTVFSALRNLQRRSNNVTLGLIY